MKYIKKYESILYYNVDLFEPFIDWFYSIYSDKMKDEGWLISYAYGLSIPDEYIVPYKNRFGDFWQIERNDDDNLISNDIEAEKCAKKYGLLIDDYGVVIGYNGVSFLEHPEELEFYKSVKKYNL